MKRQPTNPCPTCGGIARIQTAPAANGQPQIICARCSTVLPPLPYPTEGGNFFQNPTPIRQGMKALIGGKEFYAAGMIRYEEPEDEGGVSTWYEFVLLNADGDAYYLEFDPSRSGEQWTLTNQFSPSSTGQLVGIFGATAYTTVTVEGVTYQVQETGTGSIVGFQGQIPWPIRLYEQIQYVDLQESMGGRFLSGEISSETGEMEWFRGYRMDDRSMLTMFGLTHMLTELNRREARKKDQGAFGCLTMVLALLAFLFAGMSGCNKGKVIASGSAPAIEIGEQGKRFGPYKLTQTNRVYRLRVSTALTSTSVWVQGVIENTDASPFFDVDHEFWDESGYDSDGHWRESDLTATSEFRLDQPKEVYIRLFADPETQANNAPVSFELEEGVFHWGPFVLFGTIGSIVGFIWLCIAGSTRKVWDGMSS